MGSESLTSDRFPSRITGSVSTDSGLVLSAEADKAHSYLQQQSPTGSVRVSAKSVQGECSSVRSVDDKGQSDFGSENAKLKHPVHSNTRDHDSYPPCIAELVSISSKEESEQEHSPTSSVRSKTSSRMTSNKEHTSQSSPDRYPPCVVQRSQMNKRIVAGVDINGTESDDLGGLLVDLVADAEPRRRKEEKRQYTFVSRKKKSSARPDTFKTRLSTQSMAAVRRTVCCMKKKCCLAFSMREIYDARLRYWKMDYEQKQTWFTDIFSRFTIVLEDGREILRPVEAGRELCVEGWCTVLGFDRRTFDRKRRAYKRGAKQPEHGRRGMMLAKEGYTHMFGRLNEFIRDFGDLMPNEVVKDPSDTVQGEERCKVKLPASYNRKDVYEQVCTSLRAANRDIPGIDCFYKLWNTKFWHVEITKGNCFSKCTQCIYHKENIEKSGSDRAKEMWRKEREKHNALQQRHRAAYTNWKDDSISRPLESLCIIVDGMDQNKTTVPHIARQYYTKDVVQHNMMKTHLTGIIAHGRKPSIFVHSWFPYFPHDSNSTVSSIMKVLRDLETAGHTLPPRLRVQADNSSRENKNMYVMTLFALLVKFGYFEEIEMGFMIVGHTHTDVDATFSIFSRRLYNHDCLTLDVLHEMVNTNHVERPSCSVIDEMADWHSLIEPYVPKGSEKIVGYRRPHLFRWFLSGDSPAMQYKEFCDDETWKPDDGTGPIYWFDRDEHGGYAGPVEPFEPDCVQPLEMPDLTRGKEGVQMWLKHVDGQRHSWGGLAEHKRKELENAYDYWVKFLKDSVTFCQKPQADKNGKTRTNLKHGFWPKNKQDRNANLLQLDLEGLRGADVVTPLYVGPAKSKPRKALGPLPEFDPYKDVEKGHFVIMRPDDEDEDAGVPFWLGEALSSVNPPDAPLNPEHFHIDYWEPIGPKKLSKTERYKDAWAKNWRRCNMQQWQHATSVVWSWSRPNRSTKASKIVKIPEAVMMKAKVSLSLAKPEIEGSHNTETAVELNVV